VNLKSHRPDHSIVQTMLGISCAAVLAACLFGTGAVGCAGERKADAEKQAKHWASLYVKGSDITYDVECSGYSTEKPGYVSCTVFLHHPPANPPIANDTRPRTLNLSCADTVGINTASACKEKLAPVAVPQYPNAPLPAN